MLLSEGFFPSTFRGYYTGLITFMFVSCTSAPMDSSRPPSGPLQRNRFDLPVRPHQNEWDRMNAVTSVSKHSRNTDQPLSAFG